MVVACGKIVVTAPIEDVPIGSTLNVTWKTSPIPKGIETDDRIGVRIRCGKRQIPPKAIVSEPFKVGIKQVDLPDDDDLVGVTCIANVSNESDTSIGDSPPFKLTKEAH
ncbi:11544_t:CDS:2 [Funneliformis caledonium]|uniref:11544_t:CDS:1 n=1 Tax=Funneliformis caledonium TaxID=1117310 RepID=A0A9N9CZM2_9GLOM|nr:11544_t:CDS:2 [Funneliformis caledonium]